MWEQGLGNTWFLQQSPSLPGTQESHKAPRTLITPHAEGELETLSACV